MLPLAEIAGDEAILPFICALHLGLPSGSKANNLPFQAHAYITLFKSIAGVENILLPISYDHLRVPSGFSA